MTRLLSGVGRRVAVVSATVVLTTAFGGCTSTPDGGPSATSTTSGSATGSTTLSPTASRAAATGPASAAAVAANTKLTDSLYGLAAALKKAESDNSLADPRKRMNDAMSSARTLVKKQRYAAFQASPRNCTTVRSLGSQVQSATATIGAARGDIEDQLSTLRSDLGGIDAAVKRVETDRSALAKALKGLTSPPSTVSASDVSAALSDAAQHRKEIGDVVSTVSGATSDAAAGADKLGSQAAQISAKAC